MNRKTVTTCVVFGFALASLLGGSTLARDTAEPNSPRQCESWGEEGCPGKKAAKTVLGDNNADFIYQCHAVMDSNPEAFDITQEFLNESAAKQKSALVRIFASAGQGVYRQLKLARACKFFVGKVEGDATAASVLEKLGVKNAQTRVKALGNCSNAGMKSTQTKKVMDAITIDLARNLAETIPGMTADQMRETLANMKLIRPVVMSMRADLKVALHSLFADKVTQLFMAGKDVAGIGSESKLQPLNLAARARAGAILAGYFLSDKQLAKRAELAHQVSEKHKAKCDSSSLDFAPSEEQPPAARAIPELGTFTEFERVIDAGKSDVMCTGLGCGMETMAIDCSLPPDC